VAEASPDAAQAATGERRTVIVTGSATGIGAAVARRMARAGWNVVVNFTRSADEAQATERACRALGADTLVVRADVALDADCRRIVEQALRRFTRIDALVNNAGVTRFVPLPDLDALSDEDFHKIYAVNVIGAFQMARAAAGALRAAGGAVVNVSSHSGMSGFGSSIAYAVSKGALNTLTLSLARVLAPAVRVNAICPGFVDTRWNRSNRDEAQYAAFRERLREMAPLRRVVEAEEVAEAAHWLIAADAPVTGELLVMDAGNHMTVNTPR